MDLGVAFFTLAFVLFAFVAIFTDNAALARDIDYVDSVPAAD